MEENPSLAISFEGYAEADCRVVSLRDPQTEKIIGEGIIIDLCPIGDKQNDNREELEKEQQDF